jgi:hypothetical protein
MNKPGLKRMNKHNILNKIVIFVLSAQNDCFLLAHGNEFLQQADAPAHFKGFQQNKRNYSWR